MKTALLKSKAVSPFRGAHAPTRAAGRASRSAGAFTLIELILAISIMSMILAAMSSVLYIAFRLHNGVTESLEGSMPVEQALTSIQHDLANIVCNNATNGMLIGPFQSVNQTNLQPNQIGPDFYTTGGQPDGLTPWGDIEKIDFLLTPPATRMYAGMDLVKSVTHNLLPVNGAAPQPDQKVTILSGVQSVLFTYYDGTSWEQTWDSTQQTNLPGAIKMQIQMAAQARGVRPKTYELVIPVDVQMSTNVTVAIP